MNVQHIQTVVAASGINARGVFQKVTALAWSPNGLRLAVCTVDCVVFLYDSNGTLRDKFSAKPAVKGGPRNFLVRQLCFSPDSTRLALAQSDNIVYVYKIGAKWGDKKSICNKFSQPASVTAMCWPAKRRGEIVIGLANGMLRVGIVKTNKSAQLSNVNQYTVALAAGPDGESFVSSHIDGSIFRYKFPDQQTHSQAQFHKLNKVDFVPYSLAWGEHICVAGNSKRVVFLSQQGAIAQEVDYNDDENLKDFTVAVASPSGHTIAIGNFDCFFLFSFDSSKDKWVCPKPVKVPNLYAVTALTWKPDGSRLATGSLCGAVDFYDACLRRYRIKGTFEITYTSVSSIIVKNLDTGKVVSVQSDLGFEISKVNIYQDQFLVAHTGETLIIADLEHSAISEIQWRGGGKEKFYFDNPYACMIYNAGELSLVEYGRNEILGSCRTEHKRNTLISIRITPDSGLESKQNHKPLVVKKIACLLDSQTIQVLNLMSGMLEAPITHDVSIDWLELNFTADKLLFRDKRHVLHFMNLNTQEKTTLLSFCSYVQWVPESDVVVAQSQRNLCVWYSMDHPDQQVTSAIKGDIVDIERNDSSTIVLVEEEMKQTSIPLNGALIAFGSAVDLGNLSKALSILEPLPRGSPGAEGMWARLSQMALRRGALHIAERCFTAMGNCSKANYMRSLSRIALSSPAGNNDYRVRARLALLDKQYKRAERIYIDQGRVEEAVDMWRKLHKWDNALQLASVRGYSNTAELRRQYYDYLIKTNQEEAAGRIKEEEGDYHAALQLYLNAGFPAKAAVLVHKRGLTKDQAVLDAVANALFQKQQFQQAGEFLEQLGLPDRALEAYRKGNAYKSAVTLARRAYPNMVVELEEEWGDWLARAKQWEAASAHYQQAASHVKAIEASLAAGQMKQATKFLQQLDPMSGADANAELTPAKAQDYYNKIASYYERKKQYELAEESYLAGRMPREAVVMYLGVGLEDKANEIARTYLDADEISQLYNAHAQQLETSGQLHKAEKLYVAIGDIDRAIEMYKRKRKFDKMIELVSVHRKDLLRDTHLYLAAQFLTEGNFSKAEHHFCKVEWSRAVKMYRDSNNMESAMRVAKTMGGRNSYKQEAYYWAKRIGFDQGVKLLAKKNLSEEAVRYAIERGEFNEAFTIAETSVPKMLDEVHYQYALALEDEGRFERAEAEFLKAKRPIEAIEMYNHQKDFSAALRIAEQHEVSALPRVYEAQAEDAVANGDLESAEKHFVSAEKGANAVQMYQDAGRWSDALRVAQDHAPQLRTQVEAARLAALASTRGNSADYLLSQALMHESKKQYTQAIDCYLKLNEETMPELDNLERQWERAVTLAMDRVPSRINQVGNTVARNLLAVERYEAAAQVYMSIDAYKSAIDAFVAGGLLEQAEMVATRSAPMYVDYVRTAKKDYLVRTGKVDELPGDAALDVYISQSNWTQAYQLASKLGSTTTARVASLHARSLYKQNKHIEALKVLVKYGSPAVPQNFELYLGLARNVLQHVTPMGDDSKSGVKAEDSAHQMADGHQELREMLFKLVSELRETGQHQKELQDFQLLLLVAHYSYLKVSCLKHGLPDLAMRLAVSLLRYTKHLPVDKMYHDAGVLCREQKNNSMAFMFLNRFLELCDAVGDDDAAIDDSDFADTDIPSLYDVSIPSSVRYPSEYRDELLNWVLEFMSLQTVNQELSKWTCEVCDTETYEASLSCHNCHTKYDPCIVTGYPIAKKKKVQCTNCHSVAIKEHWNTYVLKMNTCPWCGTTQHPVY